MEKVYNLYVIFDNLSKITSYDNYTARIQNARRVHTLNCFTWDNYTLQIKDFCIFNKFPKILIAETGEIFDYTHLIG